MEMVFDISPDELPIFLAETDDHLQMLDEGLVRLEKEEEDPELMQALFRSAHTLKGMAGMIGHKRLVELTHALETLFDGIRKGQLPVTTALIDVCLESVDALRMLRTEVIDRTESAVDVISIVSQIKNFIADHSGDTKSAPEKQAPPPEKQAETQPVVVSAPTSGETSTTPRLVPIVAVIASNSVASAARAFQLMMALQDLGEILSMQPTLEQIETATPVRTFSAEIQTIKSNEEIRHSLVTISEIESLTIGEQTTTVAETAAPAQPAADTVVAAGSGSASSAASGPARAQSRDQVVDKTVRTSVERLDNLMNLVGELITDRNRMNQIRTHLETTFRGNEQVGILSETITHVGRITDQLQEEVMRIRMVPVSNVFSKFPRLVRDLSQKTNKDMDLVIRGQETEMDRSVIEEINDPLIHLIRNSIDHGIERPADRVAAGKTARGTILLTARHEQGRIIITVEDDGAGINTEKLKASAVARGMLTEADAAAMTKEKAVDLIFMSGVSTAKTVTDISGRGVGMDIVRNNIERINGSIVVETEAGKGSRFQIVLPLTLAIVPTLLVRVEPVVFAIPMVTVLETQRVTAKDIQTVNGRPVIILRNKVLPIARISDIFNLKSAASNEQQKNYFIVVVGSNKVQIGLMVDKLIGEEEVVVKSLGTLIGEVQGISSAAILGDGQVALIVDVQGLFKLAGAY